jgi:hypothetical protein
MARIRDRLHEYAEGFAEGNRETTFGIPAAPSSSPPENPPETLTERQRFKLEEFFHKDYGRFPATEDEFQTWLRHNW